MNENTSGEGLDGLDPNAEAAGCGNTKVMSKTCLTVENLRVRLINRMKVCAQRTGAYNAGDGT